MSDAKLLFKRYEKKYLLTAEQYAALRERLDPYIEPDEFPSGMVCSIYYDTPDCALIRHSIERPVFKEKLRLRGYNEVNGDTKVFVELKKKYKGIVYKRRAGMPCSVAEAYLRRECPAPKENETTREIDWFLTTGDYQPMVVVSCDRTAWRAKENHEIRITFDHAIRCRSTDLTLTAGSGGESLLKPGEVLMEIKVPGAAPLWLARMLSELQIFSGSFSKYGNYYKNNLLNSIFSE